MKNKDQRGVKMKVKDLMELGLFSVVNEGEDPEKEISKLFCCDLLSVAMGRTPEGAAWVTVMANINTLAVATLTDATCVILAEGAVLDEPALNKAKSEGITVFFTELPVFDAALAVYEKLDASLKL